MAEPKKRWSSTPRYSRTRRRPASPITAKAPGKKGSVMTASFTLFGQDFLALNGGPMFQFTPAISLIVNCDDQAEIDHYWEKLAEGGETQVCGWLKDKFGVSWQ